MLVYLSPYCRISGTPENPYPEVRLHPYGSWYQVQGDRDRAAVAIRELTQSVCNRELPARELASARL